MTMKTALFIRHYLAFSGGHLKILHYVQHVLASGFAKPRLLLTADSVRDKSNIFLGHPELIVDEPVKHDLLVLAGTDWQIANELGLLDSGVPILNIVQGRRHANPDDPRFKWLCRPAVRICVGQELAEMILATGVVNDPVHVVTNGIASLDHLRIPLAQRTRDVVVAGIKDPALALAVVSRLRSLNIDAKAFTHPLPHDEYLRRVAESKVAIFLPRAYGEGSYLPTLEAMALDVAVVCPDVPGIHSYCRGDITALLPPRNADTLADAARRILEDKDLSARLRANGRRMAEHHTLEHERLAFLPILAGALKA